jgi:hypothetical protein
MISLRRGVIGIAIAAVATVTSVVPAAAWFGGPTIWISDANVYAGWVDGNGPDSYTFGADCNDGSLATGVTRWAGDRRGSYADCSLDGGIVPGANHRFIFLSS